MPRPELLFRAVARLLPAEFRERVFEPSVADLLLAEHEHATSRARRFLGRVLLVVEALRLGVPQYVWRRRRLTRIGIAVLAATVVVIIIVQRLEYHRM